MRTFAILLLSVMVVLAALQCTQGLPTTPDEPSGQPTDMLAKLPAVPLFEMMGYLPKNEFDDMLRASLHTRLAAKRQLRYDIRYSTIGSNTVFATIDMLDTAIPPNDIDLFYIYACDDTFRAIQQRVPRSSFDKLRTLHIKFCNPTIHADLSDAMVNTFLASADLYSSVTDLKVFGPQAQALVGYLYDYLAVRPADQTTLRRVIQTGKFDINQRFNIGAWMFVIYGTMLHQAARDRQVHLVRQLISSGASVSAQDSEGSTPLHSTSANNNFEIADMLIAAGADMNVRNNAGWPPILISTVLHRTNHVNALIQAGADLNLPHGVDGRTALHIAVKYGHMDTVNALIAAGANLEAREQQGYTPLHAASSSRYNNIVNVLVAAGANVNAQDNEEQTPLVNAVILGQTQTIETLIAAGANVNVVSSSGISALELAIKLRRPAIENILRLNGAVDQSTLARCCIVS